MLKKWEAQRVRSSVWRRNPTTRDWFPNVLKVPELALCKASFVAHVLLRNEAAWHVAVRKPFR